jgi:hypothetical protein
VACRECARRYVEDQRSWKRSVAGYEALYERVCRDRRPPAAENLETMTAASR